MLMEDQNKIEIKLGIIDEVNVQKYSLKTVNLEYWEVFNEKKEEFDAYLIYRCDMQDKFNYNIYKNAINELENDEGKNAFPIVVLIFKDLRDETLQLDQAYSCLKATEKKEIRELFEKKISVYMADATVSFSLEDDGINYLEYNPQNLDINGYVYNISYHDLEQLFNVQGNRLFRKNIRIGISHKSQIKDKVEQNFKKYFINGIFNAVYDLKNLDTIEKEKIYNALEEAGFEQTDNNLPGNFWFNHNGVTIFIENKKEEKNSALNRENSNIEFDSSYAHVINGAQTMTNMYNQIHDIKKEVGNLTEKCGLSDVVNVENIVDSICKQIKIKTIFIEGNLQFVDAIAEGLNTQIAISENDILASGAIVDQINEKLSKSKVRIVRAGEYEDKDNISLLDFAKMYRMIKLQPGTSKNLNKNLVERILKEASCYEWLADDIRLMIEANYWWSNKQNIDDDVDENILKYGKNYFCSYIKYMKEKEYDKDTFSNIFFKYVDSFKCINRELSQNDFKKDELFHEIINQKENENLSNFSFGVRNEKEKLIRYLNENDEKQDIKVRLAKFYKEVYNTDLEFRTVTRFRQEKSNQFFTKETYPFSSKSFSQFYEGNDGKLLFDDSLFKQELEKKINLFVIDRFEDKVVDVSYITNVSFEEYMYNAKVVFEKTKNAFEFGDETLFPKSSDRLNFHVRPKAINADDTFEFTNGKQITKRAFYANKETIDKIIQKNEN